MSIHDTYCLLKEEGEPVSFQEVGRSLDASPWMEGRHEDIEALHRNRTWEFVKLPKGRKAIDNKWVYKIKRDGSDHKK